MEEEKRDECFVLLGGGREAGLLSLLCPFLPFYTLYSFDLLKLNCLLFKWVFVYNSLKFVEELVECFRESCLVLFCAVAGEEHIDRAGIRLELQILGRLGVAQVEREIFIAVVEIPRGAHAGVDAEDVQQARNVVDKLQLLRAVVEIVALGNHRQRVAAHLADVFFG